MEKLLHSKICFKNVVICSNLFGWEIELLLSYLLRNAQINARNRCQWKINNKFPQLSFITILIISKASSWESYCSLDKKNELGFELCKLQ